MDARAQERLAGRNAQVLAQEYVICVIILFFLFCHLCYPISAELKTISREDAHLMYPRYPRWRSFRGKGPDEAKEQDSRMIEETSA